MLEYFKSISSLEDIRTFYEHMGWKLCEEFHFW